MNGPRLGTVRPCLKTPETGLPKVGPRRCQNSEEAAGRGKNLGKLPCFTATGGLFPGPEHGL